MPGSSQSISGPNIALNALMAESLRRFADALDAQKIEQAARTGDTELLRQILTQVLSTDAGQRLAGKVKDAMQDG